MIHFEYIWLVVIAAVVAVGAYMLTKKLSICIMISSVVLAAAGPFYIRPDSAQTAILLVDRSKSMDMVNANSIVQQVDDSFDSNVKFHTVEFGMPETAQDTDVEAALFSAMNFIKQNGHIYLFSDLLQTTGDLQRAVYEMDRRNIALDLIVPDYTRTDEVILKNISIPQCLTINQNASIGFQIESGSNCAGNLQITNMLTGNVINMSLELKQGINSYSVPADTGATRLDYQLSVSSDIDTDTDNNTSRVSSVIHPKPVVGVIGAVDEIRTISSVISKYAEVHHVAGENVSGYDLVVIADCPPDGFTDTFVAEIRQHVSNGMGLLVLPGDHLLSNDTLHNKPFADILPAELKQNNKQSSPDGCVVFIVDTSGSMQGTRLILAKGIVRSTFERLNNYDKAGIVEFYGNRKWAAPIQSASNQIDLNRAINRLTAGGGTVILPAIEEAYYGLLNIQAASKHIVVITDGGVESADYQTLLRRIRDDNINISFILTGPATHTGFLSEMSMYGGGKFFHAADRFSLPKIDIKTLSSKKTDLFRTSTAPLIASEWPCILNGLQISDLPREFRYIPATAKITSNTILQTSSESVLTGWQVGLGKVIFSHSDLMTKQGAEKLFQNVCRKLYKFPEGEIIPAAIDNDFEIKSCQPDYELAEKIGQVSPSKPVEQIKTIDLSGYFMLITLVFFLTRIVQRRMPQKVAAVLLILVMCLGFTYAGYPETMKTAIRLYADNDAKALDGFVDACQQSDSSNDRNYALAWAVIAAQKNNDFKTLESFLLQNLNADTVRLLNIVYAINGDYDSARQLSDKIKHSDVLSLAEQKQASRQLANISLISRQFTHAQNYYRQQGDIQSLIKINLLQGYRDDALQIIQKNKPESLASLDLYELSKSLSQMGFSNMALQHAKALQSRKDDYYFEATELITEMLLKSSNIQQAVVCLTDAVKTGSLTDKQLFEVGIMFEKANHIDKAIQIHQLVYERSQATDCLMRIASLKSQLGLYDQAFNLWLDLWRQCQQPFMLYQITPYLLDSAAKNNSLVDLVIEIEDAVKAGSADQKQVDLLVDIYTSINDSFTPVEIVTQYYDTDTLGALQRQYHICRKCRLYRRCNRILKRLVEIDPDNKTDYLQQMAILAVERDSQSDAIAAAEQLQEINSSLAPELYAGLLSMLGQYDDAMTAYEQLINDDPDSYELWLLWAQQAVNTSQERKEYAINKLTDKLTQPTEDGEYLVIVDALLNLSAPERILKQAYTTTLNRIQSNPEKVYMYRLAIDILSELDPSDDYSELLLQASCYAPQRRLAFIREAMESSGSLSQQKLDMAQLLVFMNWQCSPSQSITLGQLFLENGQSNLAEYLFRSNSLLSAENISLYFTIADIHQRRSDFESALAIMKEASALYPDDPHILIETASYYEILGQFQQAFDLYTKAYKVTSLLLANDSKIIDKSKNINTAQRFNKIAFEGIVITSNSPLPKDIQAEYQLRMSVEPIPMKKKKNKSSNTAANTKAEEPRVDINMADIELEELISSNVLNSKCARKINDLIKAISAEQAEELFDEFQQYGLIVGQSAVLQYTTASLAAKCQKNQQAQDIIIQCYKDNPASRTVEFKLKSIMKDQGHYIQLAETMLISARIQSKSPHFWREITKLCYQGQDLEKAKWANAYASGQSHFVLQVLDYLFLYTKEQNIEKMRQYFRKYQIDCRKKDKYHALRWNSWDRQKNQAKSVKRKTAYMVLSQYSQLLDEFKRYSKAVYPDRRDYHEYMQAYNNIKTNSSEHDVDND